ncbi:MAG: site-specific integrase [Candidatus Thermoplasmatota archaeon]|nr:site-specific integrase [Candidatus Thermoplasmatota archaeon]MCL5730874.1 site-specific integrase [Candidatus Thermoplasmatota archaeon]
MSTDKYHHLLKDKDLRRWHHDVTTGSKVTGDVYLRRLGSFCNEVHKTPQELIKLNEKALVDLITDYVIQKEKEGKAGSYIKSTIKAVKSWLAFNTITLPRKIKVANSDDTPTLTDERIPTKEELKKIFNAGDSRERSACAIVAFSGVRIGVLGNYGGTDGLKIKDIEDLEIDGDRVVFKKIPALIRVRKELSKSGKSYLTFLGSEGCSYLETYLLERIRSGETLTPESAVITASKLEIRKIKQHINATNVGDTIRNAIRNAGFQWRPYVLRAYFDSRLLLAQDERLIPRDYRSFFMGHVGDIEHRYTVNKGRLPDDMIESMRSAYDKSTKFLETDKKGLSEEELKQRFEEQQKALDRQFREQMLLMVGFTKEEIEAQNLLERTTEEIQHIVKDKLSGSLLKPEDIDRQIQRDKAELSKKVNGARQKIIPISLLEKYMQADFEFMAMLGTEKAIIRLP